MRRTSIIIAAVAVAAVLITAGLIVTLSSGSETAGFRSSDLSLPAINYALYNNGSAPAPQLSFEPSYGVSLSWEITADIFAGYGGVLNLSVRNTNPSGKILVYAFGLEWNNGDTYERNCNVTITHGKTGLLGILVFGAPEAGDAKYRIYLRMAVSNPLGTGWYDHGLLAQGDDSWNDVTIEPLSSPTGYTVTDNIASYYNRINELVDYTIVDSVAASIQAKYPGGYSVLQIAEAYNWVATNVAYGSDGSTDYWQSAGETLSLGMGDCEDQAILIASIIGALGGNARVNIIDQHAFPTVYVANSTADLAKVRSALASYYGWDVSSFSIAYLQDEYGYWLVIDTTGFPYAGGIPAQSAPTSAGGEWTVRSSYLYAIDATGTTADNGLFGLLF